MTNCTVALNSARGGDGASAWGMGSTPGNGIGGGIFNSNGCFTAENVTIASNCVSAGVSWGTKGLNEGANVANASGTLSLQNSIVAYAGTNSNAWGAITDGGYNISSDGSANFASGLSFNFTDPLLKPVAYYGGPTLAMALATNSPAVDFGASAGAPSTDQRGLPRAVGQGIDIGAFELQPIATRVPSIVLTKSPNGPLVSFGVEANLIYILRNSRDLSNWTEQIIGPFACPTNMTSVVGAGGPACGFYQVLVP